MERLERRLSEAAAALAKLDELAGISKRSLVERDSAVLRLIFTYEAVWKTCQKLLAALENLSAASPNTTIRAARSLGWLSDEDARAAIKLGEERNLAVHMDRDEVGQQIEEHLAAHAALLHRWLDALRQRAGKTEEPGLSQNYRLFEQTMIERKQILCMYDSYHRELCPIILGHSQGEEKALTFQFSGDSRSARDDGTPPIPIRSLRDASKLWIWMPTRTVRTTQNAGSALPLRRPGQPAVGRKETAQSAARDERKRR